MDLKILCGEGKELMPDCSCAEACQVNEVRDLIESFRCIPKHSSSSEIVADDTTKATVNGFTYLDSNISSQPSNQSTTYQYKKTSDSPYNWKDSSEEKTDNNHSNYLELVVIVIVVVVFVVAVLGIIAIVRRKTTSHNQGDGRFTGQDPEAPGPSTDIGKDIIVQEKIIGTLVQIKEKATNVNIFPSSYEHLLPESYSDKSIKEDFSDTEEMSASELTNAHPLMHNLKTPGDQEDDSGVHTMITETAVKKVL